MTHRRWRSHPFTGGGTDGNEQLTATTGVLLIALLAVLGVTILRIQQLISVHLFVGLLLIGPVGLKLASTGYRFVRFYTRNPAYRRKGPPELVMRVIAPVVVLSTVVVFLSGVLLLFQGPRDRGQMLSIHKVSFIVWGIFMAIHVVGHLPGVFPWLRRANSELPEHAPGRAGRWIALSGALVGGLILALVLIPDFATWTQHGAFSHVHGER